VAAAAGRLQAYTSPHARRPEKPEDARALTGIYIGALGFCSTRAKLAELGVPVPKSWSDLLDPALKGQVSIAHPATSGTAYTALWTQMALNDLDQDAAFKYLTALNENVAAYTTSGSAPVKAVAAGTAAVGVVFAHDCVAAIADGLTTGALVPEEGRESADGGDQGRSRRRSRAPMDRLGADRWRRRSADARLSPR
jgi:iron(III) transport system substrate-binding protein